MKLTINLVPKTSWYSNVRSNVSKSKWDMIRMKCYNLANNKCEICNSNYKLECHEEWEFDNVHHIQKLVKLIFLCERCHTVKHPGLAKIHSKEHIVISQLMTINKMSKNEAIMYIQESFEIWKLKSVHHWKLDITYIDEFIHDIF